MTEWAKTAAMVGIVWLVGVTPAHVQALEPIRSPGMHSAAFRVHLGVVPPGTYRLELTTWMGGRTHRRDDVPVVVGGP